ncbi:hypothetical protein [Haloferula rosea]|uniref:Uncharacterized protein n=1 Tax=Haloferula rosea TaxID=490093 RepID=A0A934VF76_9BACT|nr:hypothetical protein [Haloferula rosea]MBK1828079.1 hypothetical protein [Haloferula rosea]
MMFLRLWLFLSLLGGAAGETLHVLVLEIDKRYVEPAFERAVNGDRDAFDEAVSKLRRLTPEQGVREWLNLEIPREDPEKRIITESMRYESTPREKKRTELGHEHLWYRTGDRLVSRSLKFNAQLDDTRLIRLKSSFHHKIDGQWSLSAALTGAKGTILILEKLVGRDLEPTPPVWVMGVLHEKKPGRLGNSSPVQDLINPPLGRAGMVRVSDPGITLQAVAGLDLAKDTDYMEGYSKDFVGFSASAATDNPALKLKLPVRGSVEMERLVSVGVKSTVSHHGKFTVPVEKPRAGEEFEVVQRDNTRRGTTTYSNPSKKKPSYYLDCRMIVVE